MNITSIFKSIRYDLDRIIVSLAVDNVNHRDFVIREEDNVITGTFDTLSSEVLRARLCHVACSEGSDLSEVYDTSITESDDPNVNLYSQDEFLDLLEFALKCEESGVINFDIEDELIAKIDSSAAKLDLTRNGYMTKLLLTYANEVLENDAAKSAD